jgi:uncharacterized YigZ family protein
MSSYKTLHDFGTDEIIIEKSSFIGYAKPIKTEEEAVEFINEIKKKHKDATHNVWAYTVGPTMNIQRYSDDGEPQGTAGMPVLSSIRMSGLTDVLVVVTRYFGGILLGAGGLVRAYSTSASLALEAGGISVYETYAVFKIVCNYSDYGKINTELNTYDAIIDGTEFGADVTIDFAIKQESADNFIERIIDVFAGKIKPSLINYRIDTK